MVVVIAVFAVIDAVAAVAVYTSQQTVRHSQLKSPARKPFVNVGPRN